MSQTPAFGVEYFVAKKSQRRKLTTDSSGKAFEAIEIATQVLRLCYPVRPIRGVHCYYNNEPVEPFLSPEDNESEDAKDDRFGYPGQKKRTAPCKKHLTIDVYFLFGGDGASRNEQDAFAVEVVFPQGLERVRWQGIARVRWVDLGWNNLGDYEGDNPVPRLMGETFVNDWM